MKQENFNQQQQQPQPSNNNYIPRQRQTINHIPAPIPTNRPDTPQRPLNSNNAIDNNGHYANEMINKNSSSSLPTAVANQYQGSNNDNHNNAKAANNSMNYQQEQQNRYASNNNSNSSLNRQSTASNNNDFIAPTSRPVFKMEASNQHFPDDTMNLATIPPLPPM